MTSTASPHTTSLETFLDLAADHRVSDGHTGALFLAALRDILSQPEAL